MPNVGRSEGHLCQETVGIPSFLARQFVKEVILARQVLTAGYSFGSIQIAKAIEKENDLYPNEETHIKEATFRWITFSSVSRLGYELAYDKGIFVRNLFARLIIWSNTDMDSTKASKFASERNWREFIFYPANEGRLGQGVPSLDECKFDGVIHGRANLAHALVEKGLTTEKLFYGVQGLTHSEKGLIEIVAPEINEYFNSKK